MAKALEGNKSIRVLFLIIFFPMKWPALYFSQVLVITSGIPHLGRWPLDLTVQFSSKSCISYHTMSLKHPNHTWQKLGASLWSMGTPNMEKCWRTRIGYAYGTRNLRTEPYPFLLGCFAVVDAAKTYGQWKNNQNYFAFLLYFNSLSCFWWK